MLPQAVIYILHGGTCVGLKIQEFWGVVMLLAVESVLALLHTEYEWTSILRSVSNCISIGTE
jgi:hypothetical protein